MALAGSEKKIRQGQFCGAIEPQKPLRRHFSRTAARRPPQGTHCTSALHFSDRIRFCLYYSTLPHPTQQNFYFVAFVHATNISPYPLRRTICPISATNPRRNKIHVLLALAGKTCVWALPRPIPDRHPLLLHHTTQRGRCQALPRLFRYFCAKSASAIA